ncbi:MAG: hypothetical protein COB09_18885 [Thalassobium sp.]|nr:MAG: hypothetical protein COB09_18885 [Thalassobium sp.]
MTLRIRYQVEIQVNTLYEVRVTGLGVEQLKPSIEVIGGDVNIYMSQSDPLPAPTGMNIIEGGAGFVGSGFFNYVHNFLYIEENATVTSVILSGIEANELTLGSGFGSGFGDGFR